MTLVELGVQATRWILVLFSLVSVGVMVESALNLRKMARLEDAEFRALKTLLTRRELSAAQSTIAASRAPSVLALARRIGTALHQSRRRVRSHHAGNRGAVRGFAGTFADSGDGRFNGALHRTFRNRAGHFVGVFGNRAHRTNRRVGCGRAHRRSAHGDGAWTGRGDSGGHGLQLFQRAFGCSGSSRRNARARFGGANSISRCDCSCGGSTFHRSTRCRCQFATRRPSRFRRRTDGADASRAARSAARTGADGGNQHHSA